MRGDPAFARFVLDRLAGFVERAELRELERRDGLLILASASFEIGFTHDRQVDCVVRPAGTDRWASLPHLATWRGHDPDRLVDSVTHMNHGTMAHQLDLIVEALDTTLADLVDGSQGWWQDYQTHAEAQAERHRRRLEGA